MNRPTSLGSVGKYVLLEEIGYGGFAAVYKAHDTELERTVALKLMHPYWQGDEGFSERFRREAHTMERLHHPNIVSVYESGAINGQLYIAMEYLPGPSLHDALKEETPFPLDRAVEILEQIASALDYAHHQGVIHRDIKPANVILTEVVGDGVRATLLDFGLVKAMSGASALTSQGMLIGSPEYMAPEQANPDARRYVGPAADRYALGVMAYRIFTGRVPFPGNTPATLNAHENKAVPPPQQFRPDLPDSFAQAVLTMLSKGPEARFATASAFVAQLRTALDAQTYHQQREARLTDLYTSLKEAARSKRWDDVLVISEQIHAIDRDYRDVKARMLIAKHESATEERVQTTPRRWRWLAAAGLILLLLTVWGWSRLSRKTLPRNPELGARWTRPSDAMEMVYVSPGSFVMGAADGDPDERPVHTVMLDGFWLDRTEVTEAQYGRCVAAKKCAPAQAPGIGAQYPVRNMTWENAYAYCSWAGARLPTEAEWEYAYRGPESYLYPWGNDFNPSALNFCDVHCDDNWAMSETDDGYTESAPVGTYPDHGSWCGALDLAGNVWEWVGDWYDADAYATAMAHNPTGPASGADRVLRGGSWRSTAYNVRGSYRFSASPVQTDVTWGFRCAR
ncbi:MAG: SUMF1/EgtB/PvdO family nonheme iron enzyme [Anaerolineae bacterium]|nr:SUMF1/EgtB/PvdO family nonheme iron enzyme [Anaerolineae bacterium]